MVGLCGVQANSGVASISAHSDVTSNNPVSLMHAVSQGPVAAMMDVDAPGIEHYKSGIVRKGCGTNPDHSVVIVGYGVAQMVEEGSLSTKVVEYWIVKNSFGASWGEDGYIRLERNSLTMNKFVGIE